MDVKKNLTKILTWFTSHQNITVRYQCDQCENRLQLKYYYRANFPIIQTFVFDIRWTFTTPMEPKQQIDYFSQLKRVCWNNRLDTNKLQVLSRSKNIIIHFVFHGDTERFKTLILNGVRYFYTTLFCLLWSRGIWPTNEIPKWVYYGYFILRQISYRRLDMSTLGV